MAEKGTSQGTVFFNKQRKRWNAQYYEYDVKSGKNKIKTKSFKTEPEANKYFSTIMYQRENPLYIEHNGIPLCEYMKVELNKKLETEQIGLAQYSRTMKTIEKIEKIPIGKKNMNEITTQELQCVMNSYNYLSKSSLNKIFQLYNRTFKNGFNDGYLLKNPMIGVIKPKSLKKTKVVHALTLDQQKIFTQWLLTKNVYNCRYKNVFLIQMYMGLRVGEALALTLDDIDLKNMKLRIRRTLTTDGNDNVIMGETTKTEAGKRVLTIPKYLYPHIVEQMRYAQQQENNGEKLLFKPNNQRYTKRGNVNSELKRILKKNFDIEGFSTHSLRHTCCTRLIEADTDPAVVAAILGQSDIEMVLGIYTDIQARFKAKELEKANEYLMNENLISNNNLDYFDNNNIIEMEDR